MDKKEASVKGFRLLSTPVTRRGGAVIALSAAGVLIGATTASALGETGTGTAIGTSDESPQPVKGSTTLCGKQATNSTITLTATGTYTAQNTSVYGGTSNVTITLTAPYYVSPAGSFGTDSTCTIPASVPASLMISTGTPTLGTSVSCSGSGTYQRLNTAVTMTFNSSSTTCTVNGVVARPPLVIQYTGNQLPCGLPPTDACATPAGQFQLNYTET